MKRRSAIRSLLSLPAAAVLSDHSSAPATAAVPGPVPANETLDTPTVAADALAATVVRTFDPDQFSALRKLSLILVPSLSDAPGSLEAKAPEFLDFLIGQSPPERITLYKQGLDRLNDEARRRTGKRFAEITTEQAAPILSPLREPWTYEPPQDPFARFLMAAKVDILKATQNSREYATVVSGRHRGAGGIGIYWYPIFD
jgi:hypothetical protein